MKRIITIQDISCVGKCSLTVALPVISACGVEAAVLPTAVLSTHTAFNSFTFRDLTCDMQDIFNAWEKENITFDGIYTGYLGSTKQIDLVLNAIKMFKKDGTFVLVDPAMADNGKLYKGFDANFVKEMTKLCGKADIIVPNLTEASFMLDIPYVEKGYNEDYIKQVLVKLTDLGCKTAVLTGVTFGDGKLGVYAYDKVENRFFSYFNEHLPCAFHGTGDIYASTVCGALAKGKSIEKSLQIAVDYTVETIRQTIKNENHNWYGVDFETAIPCLIDLLK
ncbi:MAG: pyridoxamine kinase [Clostridia bacterium]|nr:pyridoxamine kinase [Clostridia bacterium]